MSHFYDCDYIETKEGNFYIVRGSIHPTQKIRAKLIYQLDNNGEKQHSNGKKYSKIQKDYWEFIDYKKIKNHFNPLTDSKKNNLLGIWFDLYQQLKLFVPEKYIGIFGSTLIGFPISRDIDFIIYGINNCQIIKNNINSIKKSLGLTDLSEEHIKYQAEKFSPEHNPNNNSLTKTLKNKWCSMQIAPGIANTLMFGYKPEELNDDLIADDINGLEISIQGIVIEDIYCNFCPRVFLIKTKERKIWKIKTYFWAYHSAVKKGDEVLITGKNIQNNNIILDNYNHGIKIIN